MKRIVAISLLVAAFCINLYSQDTFFRRDSNFGTGFNTATGVEKGQALTFGSLGNETRFSGSGQSLTFYTVQITSRDNLFNELTTIVSAKGKGSYGAFKASGSFNHSSFRSLSINNYNQYLLVKMFVTNPDESLRSLRLTHEARALADSRPDDFLREFGDEFVARKTTGGQINVLYEFKSHSSSERNKTELAIKALASYFGASGSGKVTRNQVEDRLKEVSELRVWLLRDGGITTIPALTLEELDKYVRESFLPDVRQNPRVIGIHTRKFSDAFASTTAGISFNKI